MVEESLTYNGAEEEELTSKKQTSSLLFLISIFCLIMLIVDGFIRPAYVVKSVIKILFFLVCPLLYAKRYKEIDIRSILKWDTKQMKFTLLLGLAVFSIILAAYFVIRNFFDFTPIADLLVQNAGVTGKTFIFVAIYISFVNSLLEEFFFRGFAFLTLKKISSRKIAYIVSSIAFSVYHVAMMDGWFSIGLFILAMAGLAVGAAIFNYLNEKTGTIYNSWIVHMFANFAINTVGFILFEIL